MVHEPIVTGGPRSFLSRVAPDPRAVKSQDEKAKTVSGPSLIDRLMQSPAAARKDLLTKFVRTEAAAVLGVRTPDLVDPAQLLRDRLWPEIKGAHRIDETERAALLARTVV